MTKQDMKPEERLDRYLLGQATAEDVEFLNKLLAGDEQLRKLYRFRVALEGGYREAAIRGESLEPMTAFPSINAETKQSFRKRIRLGFVLAAASLTAITLFAVTQWSLVDRESQTYEAAVSSGNPVARLVASIDADWNDIEPMPGALFEAGRFRLDAGTVELEFNRGARVTLQGPAYFEIENEELLHISSGTLIARIPEEAIGFTITTDQAEVIDLGTEFGLSVNDNGPTDVHVLNGLVEVLPRNRKDNASGVVITEGQARRFVANHDVNPEKIPVNSREAFLGGRQYSSLGVRMLRGSVRMTDRLSSDDYAANTEGQHWINLIAEQQNVILDKQLEVALNSPGRFRKFGTSGEPIPAGTRINSYLLHFRPSSREGVRGVIRFEQPILGVLCTPKQLEESDSLFGISTIDYPIEAAPRGLEPGPYFDAYVAKFGMPTDFQSDEVILSPDRSTLSIKASADPEKGYYDQVRVLVLSED